MQIEEIAVKDIKPYENNARKHQDEDVAAIMASIKEFGFKDPIGVWSDDNIVVEGHGRLVAAKKLEMKTVPCVRLDDLTDEQRRAYALAHNKTAELSIWDDDLLDIELGDITDIDMSLFGFDLGLDDDNPYDNYEDKKALTESFIVPPFSVLDARQGYWKERKKQWLKKTGDLSETRDGEFGTISDSKDNMLASINGGTSNFDPVLAEVIYKWFNVRGGHILDPFGGEQTKGVVAGECGYKYSAVEIRQEQVNLNNSLTEKYDGVTYTCGDSNKISELIKERGFDMCFTSPPYYDLEVYSKKDMSSLGTYEEFMAQYQNVFNQCYEMLADDTFLVIKVGEIRDKKTGIYRNFVGDTITTMLNCGFKYYNEIILVTSVGTLPLRVGQSMKTRKVGKVHQNVLVFYKGNEKNIAKKFPALNFDEVDDNMDKYMDAEE